jgi:hypothetical protein
MADDSGTQNAVVIERTLEAPIDMVWQMWTEPEHFAAWYGPAGATISVAKMDVRVGGTRLVGMEMETPKGAMQMWFTGVYARSSRTGVSSTPRPCPTRTAMSCRPPTPGCRQDIRQPPRSS